MKESRLKIKIKTYMYHNSILLINAFKPVPFAGSIDFHWQIVCNFPFSFYAVFFFCSALLFTLSLCLCLTFDIFSIRPPNPRVYVCFCYNSHPCCLQDNVEMEFWTIAVHLPLDGVLCPFGFASQFAVVLCD